MVSVSDRRGQDVAHLHPAVIGEMRCGRPRKNGRPCRTVMVTIYATDEGRKAEIARKVSYERARWILDLEREEGDRSPHKFIWHVVDASVPGSVSGAGSTQVYCHDCEAGPWIVWADSLADSLHLWSTKRRAYVVA